MADTTTAPAQAPTEAAGTAKPGEAATTPAAGVVTTTPAAGDGAVTPAAPADPTATTTKKPGEQKPVVPDKYDLKLPDDLKAPEGVDVNAYLERTAATARALGLSNENANALLKHDIETTSKYAEGVQAQHVQNVNAWAGQVKADKEVGGEAFASNAELAKRVIGRFGTDAFKDALNKTGLGNHPELVRFVIRIGKTMSEDQLVVPGSTGGPASKDAASVMFPDMK